MIKTFTQTDLIRYLYREITEEEKSEIDRALKRDANLREMYHEVRTALRDLDEAALQPSQSTVASILDYSRTLEAKE